MIVYVSIGNSDDKLSQEEWSNFWGDTSVSITSSGGEIHGAWMSHPGSRWQNACWCVEFEDPAQAEVVKLELRRLADTYRQDSIAWAVVPHTEFLRGTDDSR